MELSEVKGELIKYRQIIGLNSENDLFITATQVYDVLHFTNKNGPAGYWYVSLRIACIAIKLFNCEVYCNTGDINGFVAVRLKR